MLFPALVHRNDCRCAASSWSCRVSVCGDNPLTTCHEGGWIKIHMMTQKWPIGPTDTCLFSCHTAQKHTTGLCKLLVNQVSGMHYNTTGWLMVMETLGDEQGKANMLGGRRKDHTCLLQTTVLHFACLGSTTVCIYWLRSTHKATIGSMETASASTRDQ